MLELTCSLGESREGDAEEWLVAGVKVQEGRDEARPGG